MSELTQFPLTTAAQMPAADWTDKNPVLEQFQMGVESDTGKAKVCMGPRTAWNSLDYWSPSGGGVQIKTTTVQTNVGTKQALLAAVPTGKKRIVTQVVARNASASLAAMGDDCSAGFNAGADDAGGVWDSAALAQLLTSTVVLGPNFGGGIPPLTQTVGMAGEIFGLKFADASITATLDIDVHYYDVDA